MSEYIFVTNIFEYIRHTLPQIDFFNPNWIFLTPDWRVREGAGGAPCLGVVHCAVNTFHNIVKWAMIMIMLNFISLWSFDNYDYETLMVDFFWLVEVVERLVGSLLVEVAPFNFCFFFK